MPFYKKQRVYKRGKDFYTQTYYARPKTASNKPLLAACALAGAYVLGAPPFGRKNMPRRFRLLQQSALPPAKIELQKQTFHYTGGSAMDALDQKIVNAFPGKIVRKDLTAMLKRGANVPTFVLEYLLGMYCATDDETAVATGIEKIRKILAENYVRPEESEKIKSLMQQIDTLHREIANIHKEDDAKVRMLLNEKQQIKFDKIQARKNKGNPDFEKAADGKKPSRKRMRNYGGI